MVPTDRRCLNCVLPVKNGAPCTNCRCPFDSTVESPLPPTDLPDYLPAATANKDILTMPGMLGHCLYCLSTFPGEEIVKWTFDKGGWTAICRCEIDAVVPLHPDDLTKVSTWVRLTVWRQAAFG